MSYVRRLAMVILMESDVEKSVSFYEKIGARKICIFPKSWAELVLDGVTIALCHTDSECGQRRTGLVFAVDDLQIFHETHKNDIQFLSEPVVRLHGIMASIQDPGGNVIELYQATPEKVREFMAVNKRNDCCGQKSEKKYDDCCRS